LELELSEAKRHQEEAVAAQEAAKAKAFEQQAATLMVSALPLAEKPRPSFPV